MHRYNLLHLQSLLLDHVSLVDIIQPNALLAAFGFHCFLPLLLRLEVVIRVRLREARVVVFDGRAQIQDRNQDVLAEV